MAKFDPKFYQRINCNLCGSSQFKIIIEPEKVPKDPRKIFSASGGIRGTQQIVRCQDCGLVYVNPRLKPKVVISAYAEADDSLYASQAEARIKTFQEAWRLIEKYHPEPGKILDVGAAAGFFLKVAKEAGWTTYGVEPSKWSVEFANKHYQVNVKQGTLREAKFRSNFFDVITLWDVLEHVPDPLAELTEIYRILKPGGMLVVNYPDFGDFLARLAGKRWWFLLSVHLFYFERHTLTKMLHRAGFFRYHFRPHWQSLSLGHLAKMLALYSPPVSKLVQRLFRQLHLDNLRIKYYASQTNLIAWKPRK